MRSTAPRSVRVLCTVGCLTALSLVLAACGDSTDATADDASGPGGTSADLAPLADTSWALETLVVNGTETPVVTGSDAALDFVDKRNFSANTGCNVLNGTYKQRSDALTLEPGPMTKRACTDPALEAQEQAMVDGLAATRTDTVADGVLTLFDENGDTVMTFREVSRTLDGTDWTVTGVNNGQEALEGVDAAGAPTLVFDAGGDVTGSTGCNSFTGRWTQDGDTITVTGLTTTGQACEGAAATLEQNFLSALGRSTTVERSVGTLTLRDDQGAMQVTARD